MRVLAITKPLGAALLSSILTATLFLGVQIASASDDGPSDRASATVRVGDYYHRTKTIECPLGGPDCPTPNGTQVNCNVGDFATGGGGAFKNLSTGAWNVNATHRPIGTRGWRNDSPLISDGFMLKLTVKCVDLTP